MIIHRLEVEGFGIIAKKLSLAFPEQGKIGIFGVNESGKSSLFRAIEFALFGLRGSSIPSSSRENLVTWGKQHAKVMLEFSSGSNRYRVERTIGVRSGHEVHLRHVAGGQVKLLEHNVREVERTIEEITGMDRDAFTKLIYIKQKELDTLKELTRARREELVNKLMGMDVFDQADDKVKEELRQLEISLVSLKGERDHLAAEHKRFQELQSRRSDLSNELAQLEEKRAGQDRHVQELTAEFRRLDWLKQHNDLSTLHHEKGRNIENLEEQLNQREKLREELATIQKEITGCEALQTQHQTRFEFLRNLHQQLIDWQKQVESCDGELEHCRAKQQELEERVTAFTTEKDKVQREYDRYAWAHKRHSLEEQILEKKKRKQELKERLDEQQQLVREHEVIIKRLTECKSLLNEKENLWNKLVEVLHQAQVIHSQLVDQEQDIGDLQQQSDRLLAKFRLSKEELRKAVHPQRKQQSLVLSFICMIASILGVALTFVPSVGLIALVSVPAVVPAYIFFRRYQKLEQINVQYRNLLNLEQQIQAAEAKREKLKGEMSNVLGEAGMASVDEAQRSLDQLKSLFVEKAGVDSLDALREKARSLEDNLRRCEEQLQRLEEQQPAAAIETIDQELVNLRRQLDELQKTRATGWEMLEYSEQELIQAENILREAEKALTAAERDKEGATRRIKELEDKKKAAQRDKDTALMQHGFSDPKQIEDELDEIIALLESQAGVTSFEALVEKIKSRRERKTEIEQRLQELTALGIENMLERQCRDLREIEEKLAELSREKPKEVEAVKFSERRFKRVQEERENAQAELRKTEGTVKERRGALAQIDQSLREIEGVAEHLRAKEQEYLEQDYQRRVLERVRAELAATSSTLRAQVIPYAEMLINKILPVITDSRYFQLKIDDDLKFKVSSREAGDMKERDVFSGGTQDQFLIALRLAFTQSILDSRARADRYCLLMDECISSSDEFRKKRIFTVLEHMKKAFPQIFIIAHEDITDEVDYALHLKRGKDGFTEIASKNW